MNILILGILTILPGSWIAFSLASELEWKARLAIAIALSPAILGVEYLMVRQFGIDFAYLAPILLVVNLPSGFLLFRRAHRPQLFRDWRTVIAPSLLVLMLAGAALFPVLLIPNYRQFSWHSLLHTDVIYSLTRNSAFVEEPELAGIALAYDWIGEIYWSVLGWLSNWSPTLIYTATNLIWLLVVLVLCYETVRVGLGFQSLTAFFCAGLLLLGTQTIGSVAWIITNDMHRWTWIFGDVRNTALIMAFQGFEVMPFPIALLLAITLVCSVSMRQRVVYLGVVIGFLMISVALLYPILYPVACLLAGITLLLLLTKWAKGIPDYSRTELGIFLGGFLVSVIVFIIFLVAVSRDRAIPSFQIFQAGRWSKSFQVLSSLSLFIALSVPLIVKSFLGRWGPGLVLTLTGFCLMALYVFVGLNDLESKLINAATIPWALLSAAGVEFLLQRFPRARSAVALVMLLGLISIHLFYAYRLGAGIPPNLVNAPKLSEESFWVALDPTEQDAAWTKAVRESTPLDTIVIARRPGIHLEPFVARTLYFPSDYDEASSSEYRVAPAGYSVDKYFTLVQQRGYSTREWEERQRVIEALYSEADSTGSSSLFYELQKFNRPLALHFSSETLPVLTWLEREKIGSKLFSDDKNTVWFVERPIKPASATTSR